MVKSVSGQKIILYRQEYPSQFLQHDVSLACPSQGYFLAYLLKVPICTFVCAKRTAMKSFTYIRHLLDIQLK